MYLNEQDAVAELLGLPGDVTQICLFPVAYTSGTDFKPTARRYPGSGHRLLRSLWSHPSG